MTALSDHPISATAVRALADAGITTLDQAAARQRSDIAGIRGVGAQALAALDAALAAEGKSFGTPIPVTPTSSSTVGDAAAGAETPPRPAREAYGTPPISGLSSVAPPGPGYNPLAIVALLLAFAIPPAAIVLGHVALGQIRRSGQKGRDVGIIALVLGYVLTAFVVIALLIWLAVIITVIGVIAQLPDMQLPELPTAPGGGIPDGGRPS